MGEVSLQACGGLDAWTWRSKRTHTLRAYRFTLFATERERNGVSLRGSAVQRPQQPDRQSGWYASRPSVSNELRYNKKSRRVIAADNV